MLKQYTLHNFDECVKDSKFTEKLFKKTYKNYMPNLYHVIYEYDRKNQKNGIDFIFKSELGTKEIKIDLKVRNYSSYKYKDILLEDRDLIGLNEKPGWFHTSKSDWIVYMWKNFNEDTFIDGYIIYLKECRIFFKDKLSKYTQIYAHSIRNKTQWSTMNRAVPIKDFHKDFLVRIPIPDNK